MRPLITILVLAATGCSGGDNNPVAPTPRYPNMLGSWVGTVAVSQVPRNPALARSTNTCEESWVIQHQDEGRFSGTWQTFGGTPSPCAQAGTINGTVGQESGSTPVTELVRTFTVTTTSTCTVASRTPLSGVTTSTILTASYTEIQECPSGTWDRAITTSMTKR